MLGAKGFESYIIKFTIILENWVYTIFLPLNSTCTSFEMPHLKAKMKLMIWKSKIRHYSFQKAQNTRSSRIFFFSPSFADFFLVDHNRCIRFSFKTKRDYNQGWEEIIDTWIIHAKMLEVFEHLFLGEGLILPNSWHNHKYL